MWKVFLQDWLIYLPTDINLYIWMHLIGAVCHYSFMRGENRFLTETFHLLLALRFPLLLVGARVPSVGFALLGLAVAPRQAVELGAVRLAAVVRHALTAVGAEDVLQLATQLVHYFRATLCSPGSWKGRERRTTFFLICNYYNKASLLCIKFLASLMHGERWKPPHLRLLPHRSAAACRSAASPAQTLWGCRSPRCLSQLHTSPSTPQQAEELLGFPGWPQAEGRRHQCLVFSCLP